MADITYPSTLPDFRLGKIREQQQTFRTSQPFAGPLFTELVTDDSPVTWGVTITCSNKIQSRQFQAFLRLVKNATPFEKEILTEEGHVLHEVKFIEMPLSPNQIGTSIWEYSGVIYASKLISNDENDVCDPYLIICHLQDASAIDIAINEFWPGT